jgi:hypothetical protein
LGSNQLWFYPIRNEKIIALFIAAGIGCFVGYLIVGHQLIREHAAHIARLQSEWQAEKEALEARYTKVASQANRAREANGPVIVPIPPPASPPVRMAPVGTQSPKDILAGLKILKLQEGGPQNQREMVRLLDDLVRSGPAALPAIRDFLASNEDVALGPQGKGKGKGGNPNGLLAGSLRRELFKVVQEIGGAEAEQMLLGELRSTTSRDELLTLAQSLEAMAPGKYKDAAIAAAQMQLNSLAATDPQGKGTKQLYEVLALYGDKSYVEQAKAQLIQADGKLNKEALDYLQASLKQENLPLLKQLMQNPQITDPKARDEVMKLVAELAGTGQSANQFWYDSIMNPNLTDQARLKAITELEKRGFADKNNPTVADLQLAQARVQLLEALRGQLQDPNQLATLDQTRAKLLIMMDPNLRQALQAKPKGGKVK